MSGVFSARLFGHSEAVPTAAGPALRGQQRHPSGASAPPPVSALFGETRHNLTGQPEPVCLSLTSHLDGPCPLEAPSCALLGFSPRRGRASESPVHRCVQARLGGCVHGPFCERCVVVRHQASPHKQARAPSSVPRSETLPTPPEGCPRTGEDRQHKRGVVHQPPGRLTVRGPLPPGFQNTDLVLLPFSVSQGSSLAWSPEQGGRPPVEGPSSGDGLAPEPRGGSPGLGQVRRGTGGPVRVQGECPLSPVVLNTPGRPSPGHGCPRSPLASDPSVCLSPSAPPTAGAVQGEVSVTQVDLDRPLLADAGLVLRSDLVTGRSVLDAASAQRPPEPGGRLNLAPAARGLETGGLAPERSHLLDQGLPLSVIETVQSARALSTRSLYAGKWRVFESWCADHGYDPLSCPISSVLIFLQHMLDQGRSVSTLKVYLAAISACHLGLAGVSPGSHPLASRFMRGARRLRPPATISVPPWDLTLVLRALSAAPFEPLESLSLKLLSLKTALLVALTSVKRVGDLTALSVTPACMQFAAGDSKVVLRPNPFYQPKVFTSDHRSRIIELPALAQAASCEPWLQKLCPVRALRAYVQRTSAVRRTDQLFVCYGAQAQGRALSTQRLSHWLVEAIGLAYEAAGEPPPPGIRAHSTRGVAASWAFWKGVPVQQICQSASWASDNTFVRFYALDVTGSAVALSVLSAPQL